MRLDNHESLQRLQEGDKAALNAFKGFCYSICERFPSLFLLRDARDLTHDITHDIYIKVLKEDLTKIDYPSTWLYRVIWNHCLDEIDKQKRNELYNPDELDELFDGDKRAEDYPPAADVYIERIAKEYCKKMIRNAIERLPKELDRIIITIGLEEKLKDKEILEELKRLHYQGIIKKVPPSEGAIRTRRSRLLADLRKIILEENDLEEIKANLRSLELPLPVEQEIMRRIPKEIMRQIPNGSLNSAPTTSKPVVPWIIGDFIAIGFALFIGSGIGPPIALQPPDSPNALEWVGRVEPVDAPVVKKPPSKLSQINQARRSNGGESENENQENDPVQKTAGDSQAVQKKDIASDKGSWTQTKGPYGGLITSLYATPERVLFAGTMEGDIYRSTDGGNTWVPVNEGLRIDPGYISSYTITAFVQKEDTLYAVIANNLFYSTKGGDSWKQLTHFQSDIGISGIAIIGETIYIGRYGQEKVSFSNDDGKSWRPFDNGLPDQGEPTLFASGTTLFAKKMPGHVFRRKAGESSWTKLTIKERWLPFGPWKKNIVKSGITKLAISSEIVYAVTADGGLFRSTDNGDWWQSIKPQEMQDFDGELVVMGNTVYCIDSGSADSRGFRSTDNGETWTMFNTNLTNQRIQSIAILSEETLYIGTLNGILRSTERGGSWTKASAGIIDKNSGTLIPMRETGWSDERLWAKAKFGINYTERGVLVFFRNALYVITGDGVAKSVDGGNSWGLVNDGLITKERAKPIGPQRPLTWIGAKFTVSEGKLYLATCESANSKWNLGASGIYCLAEDGNSWLPARPNIPPFNDKIGHIRRLEVEGDTFYVIAYSRVYRWRVGEDQWTDLGIRLMEEQSFAVSGKTVYFQDRDGKIFCSLDEGDTWMEVSSPKSNVVVSSSHPKGPQPISYNLHFVGETIYAVSMSEVFRSIDSGKTWGAITAGLPDEILGIITIQPVDGTTIYGTNSHGIFCLRQGSDSWERVAPILSDVLSLAFDGTTFFARTKTEGLLRFSLDE